MRPSGLAIGSLAIALLGCGPNETEVAILALSEPTRTLAADNAQLTALIERVRSEGGLPGQLDRSVEVDEGNAAAALAELYSDALHMRLARSAESLADPAGNIKQRRRLLTQHETRVLETAQAIDLPYFHFEVGHRFGYFGRMRYLDDAALAARLMINSSLQAATRKDVVRSLADLARALRVAEGVGRVRRIEARVLAANLRGEALRAAAAMFDAAYYESFEAEQLYGKLRDQLSDWPPDERMLIGERATVIHSYEAIRAEMTNRLITREERERLNEAVIAKLEGAAPASVDADQVRYLNAIDTLIANSDRPYHERKEEIEAAIGGLEEEPRLFAGELFSQDLPRALRVASADRARCEAWTIALAMIGKLKRPPFVVSPLTGADYTAERTEDDVVVVYGDQAGESVVLPRPTPKALTP